jgi:alkanesulfonate monooxygenase SsuD/methylene tetrahydromethanopterin reductase-like flavin-dependent oxidoreductase (luciferase family)
LIIQAGTSPKGIELGAKHAEVIFLGGRSPEDVKEKINSINKLANEKYGRKVGSIKFVTIVRVIVGETSKDAQEKLDEIIKYTDDEGIQVQIGGGAADLANATWDEDLTESKFEDIRNFAKPFAEANPGVKITRKFVIDNHHSQIVGSAVEVADELEDYVARSGIDGFNFTNIVVPENFESIVDILIPELQKRGLAQTEYAVPGGTYREQVYGEKGHTFVPEDHYAHGLKWSAGVSKEEFESNLAKLKQKQKKLIITAD